MLHVQLFSVNPQLGFSLQKYVSFGSRLAPMDPDLDTQTEICIFFAIMIKNILEANPSTAITIIHVWLPNKKNIWQTLPRMCSFSENLTAFCIIFTAVP